MCWPPERVDHGEEWFWRPMVMAALGHPSLESVRLEAQFPKYQAVLTALTSDFDARSLMRGDLPMHAPLTPGTVRVLLDPTLDVRNRLVLDTTAAALLTRLGGRASTLPADMFSAMEQFVVGIRLFQRGVSEAQSMPTPAVGPKSGDGTVSRATAVADAHGAEDDSVSDGVDAGQDDGASGVPSSQAPPS